MTKIYSEKDFENHFEEGLKSIGFKKKINSSYNAKLTLLEEDLIEFLKETQLKQYKIVEKIFKDQTNKVICEKISDKLNSLGVLEVLKNGLGFNGARFDLVYYEPNNNLNIELSKLYNQNIFTFIRQVYFSTRNKRSVDTVIFLNGVPIITIELKNSLTGQTAIDAVQQYIKDRSITEDLFKFKRCIVHLAVGNEEIYMTSKLDSEKTEFLPFNKNIINPINPRGHKTSYLWEEILKKNQILDIIQNYLFERKDKNRHDKSFNEVLIFPRYHQIDAINKIKKDILKNGTGNKYLIQHSTGSGKSYTISWLAFQFLTLFDNNNKRYFDSVIIVTDRKSIDKHLTKTLFDLNKKLNLVHATEKENSKTLKDYIEGGKPIIISTIQKFPRISNFISGIDGKKFAIIIDEVHSSQSGEYSNHVIKSLSSANKEQAQDDDGTEDLTNIDKLVVDEIRKIKNSNHISYFGFSGTPTKKTLETFGTKNKILNNISFTSFHEYTMKQSIQEKFTLDVLKTYTTYERYFTINQKIHEDKLLPKSKTKTLLIKKVDLDKKPIESKTKIIIDHFLNCTEKKIEGKGKAIVVTRSRLHCVKYKHEIDRQIKLLGLKYKTIAAFSGSLEDKETQKIYTESSINEFDSKKIEEFFKQDNYKFLIVNNKFQTGFDEPLLHTMYVDKKMDGLQCVQTLSRLNRTCKAKTDTAVIDFVNTPDSIKTSFQPFYKSIILSEQSDPNQLYTTELNIKKYKIFYEEDIDNLITIFFSKNKKQELIQPILDKCVENFDNLSDDDKKNYIDFINLYLNSYPFLSNIANFYDVKLEKLFIFLKHLVKKIRIVENDFDSDNIQSYVNLEDLKLQKKFEGQIILENEDVLVKPSDFETIRKIEDDKAPLSIIIKTLNEAYGSTDLDEKSKNDLNQIFGDLKKNQNLSNALKNENNTEYNKILLLNDFFENAISNLPDKNLPLYENMIKNKSDLIKNLMKIL